MNFLDVNVFNELKRRNYLRELKAENDKKQKKDAEKKKAKRTSMARATAMETPKAANTEEEAEKFERWFRDHAVAGTERTVQQVVEEIRNIAQLRSKWL